MIKAVYTVIILTAALVLQGEVQLMNLYPEELQQPFLICFVSCMVYSALTIAIKYRFTRVGRKDKSAVQQLILRMLVLPFIVESYVIWYVNRPLVATPYGPRYGLVQLWDLVALCGVPASSALTLLMIDWQDQTNPQNNSFKSVQNSEDHGANRNEYEI